MARFQPDSNWISLAVVNRLTDSCYLFLNQLKSKILFNDVTLDKSIQSDNLTNFKF